MSEAPAIALSGVGKTYRLYASRLSQALGILGADGLLPSGPRYTEFHALRDVDLVVRQGERIGVIGRNGAGKTTLLKVLAGISPATAGSVAVNGRVQALMSVGLGFHPEFSGYENIRASLAYSGLDERAVRAAIDDVVEFAELGGFLHQPLKTYSLGMQSRLMFAAATAIRPEILIIDEVLGAGDAYFTAKSAARMARLAASGCTLVLVSHAMQHILQFCERAVWIDGGRVRRDGPARDVVGEYEVFAHELYLKPAPAGESVQGKAFRLGQQIGAGDAGEGVARLEDGQSVFRWPSDPGPKLRSLALYAGGERKTVVPAGGKLQFRGSVAGGAEPCDCLFQITISTLGDQRVTRLVGPAVRVPGGPDARCGFVAELDPCRLGAGHYYVNFAVLPADRSAAPDRRYDLVARFCDFEVLPADERSAALFLHEARWHMQDEKSKELI